MMPASLSPDDPKLVQAARRLQRISWAWAGLMAGVGILAAITSQPSFPLAGLMWLVAALILAIDSQPAFLAMVALQWGLSLVALIPELNQTFIIDPVTLVLGGGAIEALASAFLRVILMIMAWNQFLFYRMLYGTASMNGLDPLLPHIPEVVPNRTDGWARGALALALLSLLLTLLAGPLDGLGLARSSLILGFGAAGLAAGIGLGIAFSPTSRRSTALLAVGLGMLGFLMSLAQGRVLIL